MPARGIANGKYQGSKWIRRERRLAIYMRDGLACAWCGASIEEGATLSLDHIVPHAKGGSTQSDNLITACRKCNSSRGDRLVIEFCKAVADYLDHDVTADQIEDHIYECLERPVNIAQARQIITRRGSWQAALMGAQDSSEI